MSWPLPRSVPYVPSLKININVRNAKRQGRYMLESARIVLMIRSCSLDCYKQHQSDCSYPSESTTVLNSFESGLPQTRTGVSGQDLKALFAQYPQLRAELRQVYNSSKRRSQVDTETHDETGSRSKKVNSGFEVGLKSLDEVLLRDDATSRGLEAFMKLVSEKEPAKG